MNNSENNRHAGDIRTESVRKRHRVFQSFCLLSILLATPSLFAGYADSVTSLVVDNASARRIEAAFDTEAAALAEKCRIVLFPQGSYTAARNRVRLAKEQLRNAFTGKTGPLDSLYRLAGSVLEECVVNELIPFWYGTAWDFNGYTQTPGKGYIACGYFVSTVLQQCGFPVNRYRLAQQAPFLEALSLQCSDAVQKYHGGSPVFFRDFLKRNGDGLYFVGLDCHVGFLLVKNKKIIFLHSSYTEPFCVTIEDATTSPAFNVSANYFIAELSNNRVLIDHWLNDVKIVVHTKASKSSPGGMAK